MIDEFTSTEDINLEKGNNANSTQIIKDIKFFSKDFLYFKNDILKEIKNLESKLELQKRNNLELKNTFSIYDSKIDQLSEKIEKISTIVNSKEAETNYFNEKIALLTEFRDKMEQDYYSINSKVKINSEEIRNAVNKYDKIIYENLAYPGVIGKDSKFRSFHEFIDYVLNQIKIFANFKDKNVVDFKSYKSKLDSIVNSLNYQIQNILTSANSFTTENKKDLEKKLLNEMRLFDEKFIKLRVENLESIKNLETEKKEIFEEWANIKDMKKELTELVNSSIKKINNSNHNMKKNLENYEKQFNEIKSDISSMNDLYKKIKHENIDIDDNRIVNKYKDFNNGKSEYNKSSEKNLFAKRIQSSKSSLVNYIEGNSIYTDLMKRNSEKCKQHDYSESKIKLMTMKKYYDEGISNIKNLTAYKTVNDIMNKNDTSSTEKHRMETVNNTPKTNINLNKMKQKFEEYHQDENNYKKEKLSNPKSRKNSTNHKFILLKDGNNDTSSKMNKNKFKDTEKRLHQSDKMIDKFVDKNRITKMKQLSSISFLYDDIKTKKNKFPKIYKNENNKEDDIFFKEYKKIIKKKQLENMKSKEYSVLNGLKHSENHSPKNQKRPRINSSEIIRRNYNNENGDDNSSNIFNIQNNNSIYNVHHSEVNKKINERLKKSKKSGELNKHSLFKLKSEVNK